RIESKGAAHHLSIWLELRRDGSQTGHLKHRRQPRPEQDVLPVRQLTELELVDDEQLLRETVCSDQAREVLRDDIDAGGRRGADDAVGQLGQAQLPLWVQRHAYRGVEQEALVTANLRKELAATGLEVQDQQKLVTVSGREVPLHDGAVGGRAVRAVGTGRGRRER